MKRLSDIAYKAAYNNVLRRLEIKSQENENLKDQLMAEYRFFEKELSELEEEKKILMYELNKKSEFILALKLDVESLKKERHMAHNYWANEILRGMHLEDLEKL